MLLMNQRLATWLRRSSPDPQMHQDQQSFVVGIPSSKELP